MKIYCIVSAPVRYLAYATMLAMALSMILLSPGTITDQNQREVSELFPQLHKKTARLYVVSLKKYPFTGKISFDTTLVYLREEAENVWPFLLPKTLLKKISDNSSRQSMSTSCE